MTKTNTDLSLAEQNHPIFKQITFLSVFSYSFTIHSPSFVQFFEAPWTAARQASLSLTISLSFPRFMSIASVMPWSHLILWHPLLLLPSIFPSIRDFFKDLAVCIRWPQYWSFSFSISPSNEYSGLISLKIDWFYLQSKGLSEVFSTTIVQSHQFFGTLTSLWSKSHNRT